MTKPVTQTTEPSELTKMLAFKIAQRCKLIDNGHGGYLLDAKSLHSVLEELYPLIRKDTQHD